MRTLAFFAILAAAAVQAVQSGHLALAVRDDGCSKLPKLCTDSVLLHDYQTTLTYVCPETPTPTPTATITVTTTMTTTVPGNAVPGTTLGHAASPVSTCNGNAPTSKELTTTTTVHSTMQVTVTKTTTSSSSSLTPAVITTSFSAVALSDVVPPSSIKPTWSEFKNMSSLTLSAPKPVITEQPLLSIDLTSFDLFPPHTVASPSSAAHNSSTVYYTSLANKTSSFSGYDLPTMNILREVKPTETVTTTTGVVTTTATSMAGKTRISLVALFLSVTSTYPMF